MSRLRAKVEQCNFTFTCRGHNCGLVNSYATSMVSDQLTIGLTNKDIQGEKYWQRIAS